MRGAAGKGEVSSSGAPLTPREDGAEIRLLSGSHGPDEPMLPAHFRCWGCAPWQTACGGGAPGGRGVVGRVWPRTLLMTA